MGPPNSEELSFRDSIKRLSAPKSEFSISFQSDEIDGAVLVVGNPRSTSKPFLHCDKGVLALHGEFAPQLVTVHARVDTLFEFVIVDANGTEHPVLKKLFIKGSNGHVINIKTAKP
ncbi:MAG: hypothetical protein ACTSX8_03530 [Alphaproteobacteria bacterium]